ncbi:hypothetical protein [Subtercola sp. RTI3]|uniref:hypothetical protein n=1 Tax=Subtercola sp. RTI3 TaxID=3048639 RepID=UPI002B23031C|nr:hypothetical protein [Subtercola sp. RTI3]MEA9986093.1 hypothetical protein [Subtercola sp. RTI3]
MSETATVTQTDAQPWVNGHGSRVAVISAAEEHNEGAERFYYAPRAPQRWVVLDCFVTQVLGRYATESDATAAAAEFGRCSFAYQLTHADQAQTYRDGQFITACECGHESTGQTPNNADAAHMEHANH